MTLKSLNKVFEKKKRALYGAGLKAMLVALRLSRKRISVENSHMTHMPRIQRTRMNTYK